MTRATIVHSDSKIMCGSCVQVDPDARPEHGGAYVTVSAREGDLITGFIWLPDGGVLDFAGDVSDVLYVGDAQWSDRNELFGELDEGGE